MAKRPVAIFAGLLLAVLPMSSQVASAHCPGGFAQINVYGDKTTSGAKGVKGLIPWTDPNVCASQGGVAVALAASNGLSWIQFGWWKISGGSVRGYWEFQGVSEPNYDLGFFTIPASQFVYEIYYLSSPSQWEVILSGTLKRAHGPSSWMGWSSAPYTAVQGEAKAPHVQIGKMAPGALLISAIQYRNLAGTWLTLDLVTHTPPSPYGIGEPTAGQLQLWTNAH